MLGPLPVMKEAPDRNLPEPQPKCLFGANARLYAKSTIEQIAKVKSGINIFRDKAKRWRGEQIPVVMVCLGTVVSII